MSKIIYLKDILLAKTFVKNSKKIESHRRYKSFKSEKIRESFLVEKKKKEETK